MKYHEARNMMDGWPIVSLAHVPGQTFYILYIISYNSNSNVGNYGPFKKAGMDWMGHTTHTVHSAYGIVHMNYE